VVQCLLSKREARSSNPSNTHKKGKMHVTSLKALWQRMGEDGEDYYARQKCQFYLEGSKTNRKIF
jgi:hypothetical protein